MVFVHEQYTKYHFSTIPWNSFIHNANVLLYKNDQFIDSLFADITNIVKFYYMLSDYTIDSLPMYYYTSDYIPEKDATYRVEVSHPDYESISVDDEPTRTAP